MYLPATAQEQLYAGIDSLAAPGSRAALEEMHPLDEEDLEAKRAEERAAGNQPGTFFTLIYNEKHRDAVKWFGQRGWTVEGIVTADYFRQIRQPVPPPDTDGGQMLRTGSLVTAAKR